MDWRGFAVKLQPKEFQPNQPCCLEDLEDVILRLLRLLMQRLALNRFSTALWITSVDRHLLN